MIGRTRPLVTTRFRATIDRPAPGTYDPVRQLRLDATGRPVIAFGPVGETMTAVRQESPDPSEPPIWMLETATKVMSENPDDSLAMTETETRVITEDPDDAVAMTEAEFRGTPGSGDAGPSARRVRPPADDSVTGIVAF